MAALNNSKYQVIMGSSSCRVVRSSGMLVKPMEETPRGKLPLSGLDRVPVLRCYARTLHLYSSTHHPDINITIRDALSKALVPYHPLAGRLHQDGAHIDCTAQGVWFVEASADCPLLPHSARDGTDQLLPDYSDHPGPPPLLQMQLTRFSCGALVIGLLFNHTICDGLGAAQFLTAVGDLARGSQRPSLRPVWCRDFFTGPVGIGDAPPPLPLPPPECPCKLVEAALDIPMPEIQRLKRLFHPATTFELVAAAFWRSRTRAINSNSNTSTLVFFANCRPLVEPPLPPGFYGNCFFPVRVTAPNHVVAGEAPLSDLIRLIRKAKAHLPQDFSNYIAGTASDPFSAAPDDTSLYLSEWGRLGFNQVDFGCGPPADVVPIQGSPLIPAGVLGWQPDGVRLVTWCVQQQHRRHFLHQLSLLFSTA